MGLLSKLFSSISGSIFMYTTIASVLALGYTQYQNWVLEKDVLEQKNLITQLKSVNTIMESKVITANEQVTRSAELVNSYLLQLEQNQMEITSLREGSLKLQVEHSVQSELLKSFKTRTNILLGKTSRMESKINKATKNVFRELECVSGGRLSCEL